MKSNKTTNCDKLMFDYIVSSIVTFRNNKQEIKNKQQYKYNRRMPIILFREENGGKKNEANRTRNCNRSYFNTWNCNISYFNTYVLYRQLK